MATLTATIRWATNTAELADSLKKGVAQIEITQEAAQKMVKSLGTDFTQATRQAAAGGESWTNWLSKANTILGAFGVSLSIGALVQFGRQMLADADALQKMSDRTGIGVENLQRLQRVGDDTSTTIEEMTQAINQMQDRLAGGDPSAAAAMERMGINTEKFLKLDPYQQFVQFSDALRQVANSSEQVRDANDVMGRSGVKVLAALKQGFDDAKNAAVPMSAGTVTALDAIGDAIGRLWRTSKGFAAQFVGNMFFGEAMTNAQAYAETMRKGAEATDFGRFAMKTAAPVGKELAGIYETLNTDLKTHNERVQAQTKAVKDLYPEWYALSNGLHKANLETGLIVGATEDETEALLTIAGATDTWGMGIGQLNSRLVTITDTMHEVVPAVTDIETAMADIDVTEQNLTRTHDALRASMNTPMTLPDVKPAMEETVSAFDTIKAAAGSMLGGLNDIFQRAFEGGGGVMGAIKSFATNAGKLILGLIPVVGPFLSQFSGAIVAGFEKLIGLFKSAEEKINPMRAAFVATAGGLDALRDAATAAGVTIDALLNAKNAEQYKAAIDALNLAFDEHAKDIERAKALIDEYGLTMEQLGPTWRNQQLTEQVEGLTNDLRIMVDVLGLSMPDALVVMASKFQAAFDTAMQFGMELPAQMKPILQKMIELGLLTDSSGEKYTDLEQTGVKFAETFAQSVDRLIQKFDEFLQRLGMVPGNMRTDIDVYTHHHDVYDNNPAAGAAMGGLVTAHGIQHLQSGGRVLAFTPRGTDTVPAMLTPGEEVIPVGGRAKEMAPVVAAIERLRRDLPQTIAVAVRDEVQKKVTGRR